MDKKAAEAEIRDRYEQIRDALNERARRLFAAREALAYGRGGIATVSRATGIARRTISKGLKELEAIEAGQQPDEMKDRIRRPGGGRKKATEKDPTLLSDLKQLVEPSLPGAADSPLLWTDRSLRNLVAALADSGHKITPQTVSSLLKQLGYSLQSNRKRLDGSQHPDRKAQFEHINREVRRQLQSDEPVISVATKKRELVGTDKKTVREVCPKDTLAVVRTRNCVAVEGGQNPSCGVCDVGRDEDWVSVDIGQDSAEFAVETIRTWWHEMGHASYPKASSLLIAANGSGSNGYQLRLWKIELQKLADELQFPVRVCHLPSGTSKWNQIEHRLCSFSSPNGRGKPFLGHQVVVELIASRKIGTRLTARSYLDERHYAKGRRIADKQLAEVNLIPDDFHGDWNYKIAPMPS